MKGNKMNNSPSKVQEYIYHSEYVTIVDKYDHGDEMVIVVNDQEELLVAQRSLLKRKEDSWGWKRQEERRDEIQLITAKAQENFDKLADKLVDKALSTLATRMKMNVIFGKDLDNADGWAIMISKELEKLIREDAKAIMEKTDE